MPRRSVQLGAIAILFLVTPAVAQDGPSGLKARWGVLWHNLEWFGRQLWDEDVPLPDR